MKLKGFCGPSYTVASKIAAYDRSVNLYCERVESGTGNDGVQYTLYQAPGYETLLTLSDSPGRGCLSVGGNVFLAAGSTFYGGLLTTSGSISNLTDAPVSMVTNGVAGHQVLIASDNNTYAYDVTSHAFALVGTATATTQPYSIGFLKTYGLRLDPALSQFGFSAPNDFTSWDAGDVVDREDAPDSWVRLIVYNNEVFLFGTNTTSVYDVVDDEDIPFQPNPNVLIEMGIIAPYSALVVGGDLMWIGQNAAGWGVVYRMNGYTPQRISTHAVEFALQGLSEQGLLRDAEASTYQENGHIFYVLKSYFSADFPSATWVYDLTSGLWHERGVYNGLEYDALDTRGYLTLADGASNLILTLSRTSGKVYTQSLTLYTDTEGNGIRWMRRAPHISEENRGVIIDRLELKFQPGEATATGSGSDPHFTMRFSNDGGQTWSNSEQQSMGLIGEYAHRAIWRQLGYGRDRLIEIVGSDPIFTPIIDAYVDVRTGRT